MIKLTNLGRLALMATVATVAFGTNAVLADEEGSGKALEKIALKCRDAAADVNRNHSDKILFRPITHKGVFWCAVTDREGTLKAIRASDTLEDGCTQTEFSSDAARLSELIAIAKAWTTSFSNNEAPVDSKTAGLASRIDDTGTFGNTTGSNAGPAPLWGVWATNLLRHTDRANGYSCGKRHFGVVPFAGGQPVYDCKGKLIGGAGASGDSVEADDLVTKNAINFAGFCTQPTKP
jgi:uncharacterized protein GlcG (DUF336 family)